MGRSRTETAAGHLLGWADNWITGVATAAVGGERWRGEGIRSPETLGAEIALAERLLRGRGN